MDVLNYRKSLTNKIKLASISILMSLTTLSSAYSYASDSVYLDSGILNSQVSVSVDNSAFSNIPAGVWVGTINGNGAQFFCFDINQSITVPGTYTDITLFANSTNPSIPSLMASLPVTATNQIELAAALLQSQLPTVMGNNTEAAAMQVAIWSILYNPSLQTSITSGTDFAANTQANQSIGGIIADANAFLADANAINANLPLTFSQYDQIPFLVGYNGSQIISGTQVIVGVTAPEPGTYIIMGSLLALIGMLYYFRVLQKSII